MEYFEQNSFFQ